jgi:tellurite resistance protein
MRTSWALIMTDGGNETRANGTDVREGQPKTAQSRSDLDPAEAWRRLDNEPGDLSDILDAANRVASVDGTVNPLEEAVISELQDRCRRG